jgi:hypothetical protein
VVPLHAAAAAAGAARYASAAAQQHSLSVTTHTQLILDEVSCPCWEFHPGSASSSRKAWSADT